MLENENKLTGNKMSNIIETDVTEQDLDELMDELQAEVDKSEEKPRPSFWKNLYRSWNRPKPERNMVLRFQQLAGIIPHNVVAALIMPNGLRIEFKELPSWKDVIRYKIAGFTYETYYE